MRRVLSPLWLFPALAAACFWRLLFAGRVLVWGTALLQFYPWETLAARLARAGELPLWNPYAGNGAPLLANLQSAVFYPPNWLYLFVPVESGMGWLAAAHVAWAGLGAYLFLRRAGVSQFGALFGALAFEFNGYLIVRLTFLSMSLAIAWLPWVFWAAEGLLARRRLADALWLALAIALQLLAGHAQTTAHTFVALALYAAARVLATARSPQAVRLPVARVAALLAGGLALGVALAAIQLAPTVELLAQSPRAGGVDRGFALQASLLPVQLAMLVVPDLFGAPAAGTYWGAIFYHEALAYVGVLPLVLALGAVARLGRRVEPGLPPGAAPALAVIGALGIAFALGSNNPVFLWLFDHAPGFNAFQAPARWSLLFVWAACVLGALGAARWARNGPGPEGARGVRYWARLSIAGGLAFTVLLYALRGRLTGHWSTFADALLPQGVLVVVLALLALLQPELSGDERGSTRWQTAVLLVLALDLLHVAYPLNLAVSPGVYHGASATATALRAAGLGDARTFVTSVLDESERARRFDRQALGPEDSAYWLDLRDAGMSNTALLDDLRAAGNFDPLLVLRYRRLMDGAARDARHTARAAQLSAAGALAWQDAAPPEARWGAPVARGGGLVYYRVPDPLPRAYVVPAAELAASPDDALARVFDPAFDPRRAAVLEHAVTLPAPAAAFTATAEIVQAGATAVIVVVRASAPGVLVLADTAYPGWQAHVNGQPVEVLNANYAFRAVLVPAGASRVEWFYRPDSFTWGAGLTAVAGALMGGLALAARRTGRRAHA
jgi:hypothetical protein